MLKPIKQLQYFLASVQSFSKVSTHFETYPPIFIIGAPRSGTTLTLKLFENQPFVSLLFEGHDFWRRAFRYGLDDTYQHPFYLRFLTPLSCLYLKYLYYQQIQPDQPYLVVKDPRDSIRVDTLNRLFPNAKFIHVVRDGRDVIASMMKTYQNDLYFSEDGWLHVRIPRYKTMSHNLPHINAAIQWKYCVETTLKHLAEIPSARKMTFHYEDLITEPNAIAHQIVSFGFAEFDQEKLKKVIQTITNQVVKTSSKTPIFASKKKLSWQQKMKQFSSLTKDDAGSGTTAESVRVGRWKLELDEQILQDCYSVISDTLKQVDYE